MVPFWSATNLPHVLYWPSLGSFSLFVQWGLSLSALQRAFWFKEFLYSFMQQILLSTYYVRNHFRSWKCNSKQHYECGPCLPRAWKETEGSRQWPQSGGCPENTGLWHPQEDSESSLGGQVSYPRREVFQLTPQRSSRSYMVQGRGEVSERHVCRSEWSVGWLGHRGWGERRWLDRKQGPDIVPDFGHLVKHFDFIFKSFRNIPEVLGQLVIQKDHPDSMVETQRT